MTERYIVGEVRELNVYSDINGGTAFPRVVRGSVLYVKFVYPEQE